MKHITLSILISISLLTTGCLFLDNDAIETTELSKKEAKKRSEKGDTKDYCEIFGWYGDGTCDEFCSRPDMDCSICDVQPQCEEGFELCLSGAIAPECEEGYHRAETCDEGLTCIPMEEPCRGPYFCVEDVPNCLALPSCQENQFEVEKCKIGDDLCQEVSLCGSTS